MTSFLDSLPTSAGGTPASSVSLVGPANFRSHFVRGGIRLVCLLAADLSVVLLGWWLVQLARDGRFGTAAMDMVFSTLPPNAVSGTQLAVALVAGMMLVGGYRRGDPWRDPVRTLSAAGLAVILTFYSDVWHASADVVVVRALVIWLLVGGGLIIARALVRTLRETIPLAQFRHPVLEVRGSDGGGNVDLGPEFPVVATLRERDFPEDLAAMESWLEGGVDTILVSGSLPADSFGDLTDFALTHGCRLICAPRARELVGIDSRPVRIEGHPLLELTAPGLRASQLVLKRVLDVFASVVILILASPLLAAIALWIRADSPGPVLFSQARPGFRGRRFPMLKFRSMRADAEEVLRADPELYELFLQNDCKLPPDLDPRITQVGHFLRRTSLDELPQLLNVLRGDMSLVGPRPLVGPELENYSGKIPALLSVKPGMTGLWQITGRSRVTFPERAILDLEYVRNWSLLRDLWIMFMTVPAVLYQRGAH